MSQSIWNQDEKGEWKLYFNTQTDLSLSSSQNNKEEQKQKTNVNKSEKNLCLGNLVMTPKGIGHIIKKLEGIAYIRFNQDNNEYKYSMKEISNYLVSYLIFSSKGNNDIIRLKLKVDGKVENIFEELIKIKKINIENDKYSLIYNKTLLKNENTFEQLKLKNNEKILIIKTKLKEKKVNRFTLINDYWYSYKQDGISFSVSKNIKLLGVGLYRSHTNREIQGVLKILQGNSITDKVIAETNATITPSSNQSNCIFKIMLQKPLTCLKNKDYSIFFLLE